MPSVSRKQTEQNRETMTDMPRDYFASMACMASAWPM